MTGLNWMNFELLLAERKAVRNYDLAELKRDLDYANSQVC